MLSSRVFAGVCGGIKVDDVWFDIIWNFNWGKAEVCRGKDTPGWTVCRIVPGVDILGFEDRAMSVQKVVNSFKDSIGLRVAASSRPPPLDNTSVVTIDLNSLVGACVEDGPDEEFHGHCFSPANVPTS